jgi:hypothetical protein
MKVDTKFAFGVFGISLVVLFVASARAPLGAASSDYAALVNQAEDVVHALAQGGPSALAQHEVRSQFEQLTTRPLAPLLSAWSALSLGRIGVLDGSSSVRLPWLILAGCATAAVFFLLRDRWGMRTAAGAALWLLLSPGFVTSALSVQPTALGVWSGWLVLVAYAWVARERATPVRAVLSLACGALAFVAFGLSFCALWVVPVMLALAWVSQGRVALLDSERGHVPVPVAALLAVVVLPLAILGFDPALWHTEAPAIIRRVFSGEEPTLASAPRLAPLALPALLGLCGLGALTWHGLGRRFATGEFRPPRDRSALGALLTLSLGSVAAAWGFGVLGPAFAVELSRPILACLVAIGAASLAGNVGARHARLAEPALLLLALLVR